MSNMRNDDFNDLEQMRIMPTPEELRKALRLWAGAMKAAFPSETHAVNAANAIKEIVGRRAGWTADSIEVSDNIVLVTGARYQARSANANDAEQLVRDAAELAGTTLLSLATVKNPAVKTFGNAKLSVGR